jgi:CTP:molybdopterin cytidylyltransferase MocA
VTVAGLVLAGGAGRRFGGPKALARLDGVRLVDIAVRTLRDGGCSPVVVVSGAADLDVESATVVPNPLWDKGIGSSLHAGLGALADLGSAAAIVLLVDTPWVSPAAVSRLAAGAASSPAAIATYDGRRGHPVFLSAAIWAQVAELANGDVGAKAWLQAHPEQVLEVDCTGLGDPRDVDRPEDMVRPADF